MTPRKRSTRSDDDRLNLRNIKSVGIVSQLSEDVPNAATNLPLDKISLSPSQPRKYFDSEKMQQLVESVRRDGILQPLLVRPLSGERFELVAGERRYRAAETVGLTEVPVTIREMSDDQARQFALVENLQREDLNPVEETEGILGLLVLRLEKTVEEVISFLRRMENEAGGKATNNVIGSEESSAVVEVFTSLGRMSWESFVKNRLAILNLPEDILKVLRSGQLEYTKGRALAQVKDESFRQMLLEEVVTQGLSLNQIRERIKALKSPESPQPPLEAEELRKQLGKLNRLSKKSKALENPKTRQQVEKLLSQLQDLLSE
jgi:ParB family chromosome partitioning protein